MTTPFARRISEAMRARGMSLRELCREASLDPSFFSKVLSGKRSPPSEEDALRRLARLLGLDEAELIVSAGRVPAEWAPLWRDPSLFARVHALATGTAPRETKAAATRKRDESPVVPPARHLSEELL